MDPVSPEVEYHKAVSKDIESLVDIGKDLFDHPIKPDRFREFMNDPRHHLFLAHCGDKVVGFASGFHYVHPDKDPQMFINEVSVLEEFQNRGIGRALVRMLVDHGKKLGCVEAWIATELDNKAARKAYIGAGGKETDKFILIEYQNQ